MSVARPSHLVAPFAAAVAAAAGLALATPSRAAAQGAQLRTQLAGGRCLVVQNASRSATARLILWDCNGGTNEYFTATPAGELRLYGGTMCVDALGGGGNNGDPIGIYQCTGGANQRWTLANGALRGVNGRCMDVASGGTTNGSRVVLWDCHGGANQRWTVAGSLGGAVASAPAPAGVSETAARGLVVASYQAALQREPSAAELGHWVPRTMRENLSLEALTRGHAEWGARETYQQVLRRAPSAAETQAFVGATLAGRTKVDRLWSELMVSAEYRGRHGRNGPASVEYGFVSYGKSPQFNRSGTAKAVAEQCFGAIGPKCQGFGPAGSNPRWFDHFTRADGVQMAYVEIETSVGSIAHDNACRNVGAAGTWCNGDWARDETVNRAGEASSEWKKAVLNSMPQNRRFWKEKFGPYPVNDGLRASYSDDLEPVPARSTMLPVPGGEFFTFRTAGVSNVALLNPYAFDETRESRRLKAPSGQALDTTDGQFCASERFAGAALPGMWGTCQ